MFFNVQRILNYGVYNLSCIFILISEPSLFIHKINTNIFQQNILKFYRTLKCKYIQNTVGYLEYDDLTVSTTGEQRVNLIRWVAALVS